MTSIAWSDVSTLVRSSLIGIYVPAPGQAGPIAPRSAIVGRMSQGQLKIDFEGGLHGAAEHVRFAGRLRSAAGRHLDAYPTVARRAVPPEHFLPVGLYDGAAWRIEYIDALDTLMTWLTPETLPTSIDTNDHVGMFDRLRDLARIVPGDAALARFAHHAPAMIGRTEEVVADLERLAAIYDKLGLVNGAQEIRAVGAWTRTVLDHLHTRLPNVIRPFS